ncbi:MAG: dihydroxy-acid dehydratase [Clostridiaceae bacterium BRH_c20a]|nr:MAG: dihydroxy-acid dehydratase [Clostridiaceae bacterium BRH_c20a]
MRSSKILKRPDYSFNRSVYKSMGYCDDDLARPIIGIVNSWNTLVPGHFNLQQVSEYVKRGIYRGGCTCVEFGVIGACDGTAQGHEGMHYILPSRELIANDIEVMVQAHQLDGIVLLGSCDKIVPAMLMAAARLDIPAILIPGGPMLGGVEFGGRKSDLTSVSEALGMLSGGKITEEEYLGLEEKCCPSCGSCAFLGTANTMCCLSEALGMTLSGGALIPATHPDRLRISQETGLAICKLVAEGITARQIINRESIENAVKVCLGISGSTNAVLHLTALAYEAEVDIDVLNLFDVLSKKTPQVVKVNPASEWDMDDFWNAGGIPRVLENMGPILNTKNMTCSGSTLEENIVKYKYKFPPNPEIIKTLEEPFEFTGGIAVLRGNLAPNSGISKPGAVDPSLHSFTGNAKVFDSEEEAEEAILNNRIKGGDIVVIRYEGPKGGPGMREMYKAMKYLFGLGLNKKTALITDGRFSGTNNGCFVGHISPEAAEGGPIAIVQDGDTISLDIMEGIIHLHVDDEEIKRRFKVWKPPIPKFKRGYLSIYSKLASSASEGAIMKI